MFDLLASLGAWNWLIGGFVLMALELLAPGMFLFWLGLAALLTGLIDFALQPSWQIQLVLFALLSVAAQALLAQGADDLLVVSNNCGVDGAGLGLLLEERRDVAGAISAYRAAIAAEPGGPFVPPTNDTFFHRTYPLVTALYLYVNRPPGQPLPSWASRSCGSPPASSSDRRTAGPSVMRGRSPTPVASRRLNSYRTKSWKPAVTRRRRSRSRSEEHTSELQSH